MIQPIESRRTNWFFAWDKLEYGPHDRIFWSFDPVKVVTDTLDLATEVIEIIEASGA